MEYYYAVEFLSGTKTTMGEPNAQTGRYDVACTVKAFHCKKHLDQFVREHSARIRKPVGLSGLRQLRQGLSLPMFKLWLDDLQSRAD